MTTEEIKKDLELHKKWLKNEEGGKKLDWSGKDLQGANLQFADLQGAILQNASLQGADLYSADLRCAILQFANLQGANLQYANLRNANLQYADLRGADLQYADLQFADLQGANLRYADLRGAVGPLDTVVNEPKAGASVVTDHSKFINHIKSLFPTAVSVEVKHSDELDVKRGYKYYSVRVVMKNDLGGTNTTELIVADCQATVADVVSFQGFGG